MHARTLTLGYSPCPNDTFIFHALAHGIVNLAPHKLDIRLADVEELNRLALAGAMDLCKVSAAVLPRIMDRYVTLRSGGAMGRGVGPLVMAARPLDVCDLNGATVAVPGLATTGHLLFSLLCQEQDVTFTAEDMIFSQVMEAVASGRVTAGVIIHEGRFTFEQAGLFQVADLGQWWEEKTGLPLPLGAIVARRDLGSDLIGRAQAAIRASLEHARAHPEASAAYIQAHAQELDPAVIAAHIRTFVTDFSLDLGAEGETALDSLIRAALSLSGQSAPDLPLLAPSLPLTATIEETP